MYKSVFPLILLLLLSVSCVQENTKSPMMGTVSFSAVSLETFTHNLPNQRIIDDSGWQHIFIDQATVQITHKSTGDTYYLDFNPNNLKIEETINLPYGNYSYSCEVEGGDFENYLPFEIKGTFKLSSNKTNVSLKASTNYGLVTLKSEFVNEASIGEDRPLNLSEDGSFYYLYIKEKEAITLTVSDNFQNQPLQYPIKIQSFKHYHFFLHLIENQNSVTNIELTIGLFKKYLDEHFGIDADEIVYDASGNAYKVVKIGKQYWMAQNLISTKFCNGEDIEEQSPPFLLDQYFDTGTPVVIFASFNQYPQTTYYSIDVINSQQNICPCNWHIATDDDWKTLERYLGIPEDELSSPDRNRGMDQNAGGKIKSSEWRDNFESPRDGYNLDATNETKFSALPSGYFLAWDQVDPDSPQSPYFWASVLEGTYGIFWAKGSNLHYNRQVYENLSPFVPNINKTGIIREELPENTTDLFPIRCVKD